MIVINNFDYNNFNDMRGFIIFSRQFPCMG